MTTRALESPSRWRMRWSGNDGSMGTEAPPALAIAASRRRRRSLRRRPLRPRTRRRRVPVPLQQQASELVGARIQLGVGERPTGIGDRKRFGRSSRDRFDPLVHSAILDGVGGPVERGATRGPRVRRSRARSLGVRRHYDRRQQRAELPKYARGSVGIEQVRRVLQEAARPPSVASIVSDRSKGEVRVSTSMSSASTSPK